MGKHPLKIIKLTANFQPHHRSGELYLKIPNDSCLDGTPVLSVVKAIARSREWYVLFIAGKVATVGELARKTGLTPSYVTRILKYAMLSPEIIEAILTGKHPHNLTLRELQGKIAIDWREQQKKILRLA